MPDNLQNRGPADRSRINIHESWERRWWSSKFGVSEDQLVRAVNAVGTSASAVEAYLRKHR